MLGLCAEIGLIRRQATLSLCIKEAINQTMKNNLYITTI
jgi:hypothetical protein